MGCKTTICTAIPYVNSTPHIGTVLDTIAGDATARFMRMRGEDVFFQVGTDENGLKIKEAAEAQGRDPHEFVDEIAGRYKGIFDQLNISYDSFIRTTESRHILASQEVFRRLQSAGHIYKGQYEGWYDVSTETFYKQDDLVDGKSPDGNPVRWVSEENWFFRMSAFEKPLLEYIENHAGFIRPSNRRNEALSFINQGLRDIAISRQNPGWGIPVPDDESQVIYVWFDAVINYISVLGWPDPESMEFLPAKVQWVGKDILTRFHATLWPAILMGLGLPLPESVVAHGWVLLGGEKISKSKGEVVQPIPLAAQLAERSGCAPEIAIDVVRHYLLATMSLENDSIFTFEAFDERYNVDLANDLGNALNRSLAMAHKFVNGVVPDAEVESEALEAIKTAKAAYADAMGDYRLDKAVAAAFDLVRFLNKYIDTRAPWALNKSNDPALPAVLRSMLLLIRSAEALVRPSTPTVANAIAAQLGLPPILTWDEIGDPETMPGGHTLGLPVPIFPRLEREKKTMDSKSPTAPKSNPSDTAPSPAPVATPESTAPEAGATLIDIADFAKVKLRVGRIFEAEPVEKSDKLFKLQVVVGEEKRQVVAGIRANYTPEDLIGRQVVVVMNLKPAKLRGVDSQGMLLAATDENGGAILLQPDKEAPEGTEVR